MSIFSRKPLEVLLKEANESGKESLKKTLSSRSLIALGVGAIIGAGLFSLTGIAAADHAGPAVTLSFVVAAIGCAFAGLCYAEFASMIPVAGSAYTYSYATMGEFMAWIIGWDLVLEYALASATVGVSWSAYLNKLLMQFGYEILPEFANAPADGGIINLPAIFIVCILSLLLVKGTKESAFVNNILVVLKLAVVILFIILGWHYIVSPESGLVNADGEWINHVPYIPEPDGRSGFGGWQGITAGAAVVFFAFIGFDAVSTAAQEAKNPQKGMPIGILGSLIVCTILYVLFSHVMTGLVPYKAFAGDASPAATAFAETGYDFLQTGLIIAIIAGYTSVILVMLMGQSRVFYSMSKDGLLPKFFSEIHSKFQTPWKTNLFFLAFVSIFAGFVPIKELGHMVSIGTLFAFALVCIGVLVMRRRMPNAKRAFKVPFVPVIPILGVLVCVYLMLQLDINSWARLFIWIVIGLLIYFTYSKRNSKLQKSLKEKK